jgi:hypothetical protein
MAALRLSGVFGIVARDPVLPPQAAFPFQIGFSFRVLGWSK